MIGSDYQLLLCRIAWGTSAGKELISWFSICAVLLYAVLIVIDPFPCGKKISNDQELTQSDPISHMASGEGCIRLYRFLIIAFSSTP